MNEDYILLPAPNRLITSVRLDIRYSTRVDLELVRQTVNDNGWGIEELKKNFPSFEIEVFPPWNGDKKYSFIVYGTDDPSAWLSVLDDAEKDTDPNFMIFMAYCFKMKRISNALKSFI